MLKGLLLEKASSLTELHINFEHNWSQKQDVTPVAHLFEEFNEFELPKLNVLRVQNLTKNDYGIVADILRVAPNANSFEKLSVNYDDDSLGPECFKVEELTMLQSLNKLHCLKRVNLSFDEILVGFLEQSPQFVNLPFESIILSMNRMFTRYTSQDAELINKIFCASKHSLLELLITPVGSILGVELPRFENLKKLTLSHADNDGRSMFPQHFDMANNLPSLRELGKTAHLALKRTFRNTNFIHLVVDILDEDAYFSTYQPTSVMPNVEFLTILGDCKYDEKLMKMTPNVKTLVFEGEEDELPSVNFDAIALHLTSLENLKWQFHAESPEELQSSCELDAMITGFSEQFCKKLSVQLRNVEALSARKIASHKANREYTSLLDLKGRKSSIPSSDCFFVSNKQNSVTGLKRHDITLTMHESSDCSSNSDDDDNDEECCDMAGFQPGSIFYKTGLTKVSKLLAFDLMPNLKTNIQVRYN